MTIASFIFLVLGNGSLPQPSTTPNQREIDSQIEQLMQQTKVPGLAIARIQEGQVAWIKVFGKASPQKKVTSKTPFNVASLTKPAFAMLVLQMVAKKQFSLDESLAPYWLDPDVKDDPRVNEITGRMALSHQTGFPNWRGRNPLTFQFDPGQRTDYSGEGYEYLRKAIEKASAKSLRELVKLHLKAIPAESFGWSAGLEGEIAVGFDTEGQAIDGDYLKSRGPAAASSLFCTIEDYGKFTAWVSSGADLPKDLFHEIQKDQAMHGNAIDHFGLGWRVVPISGQTVLTHDGREDGVRTQVYVFPKEKSGLVWFTNSSNGEMLIRPLTQWLLPQGAEIMDAMDANAWDYASSVPAKVQPRMLQFIANSPAFVSKLLHGAEITLIRPHYDNPSQSEKTSQTIQTLCLKLLDGQIESEPVHQFLLSMAQEEGEGLSLKKDFNAKEAKKWLNGLAHLTN